MRRVVPCAILLALSCTTERSFEWQITLDDAIEGREVVAIDVKILVGGCESTSARYTEVLYPGSTRLPDRPPALEDGLYGFEARARGRDCRWFGRGCLDVPVTGASPGRVDVRVGELVPDESACDCMSGRCTGDPFEDVAPVVITPESGTATGSVFAPSADFAEVLAPTFRWRAVGGADRYELRLARCGTSATCDLGTTPSITTTETSHTPVMPLAVETMSEPFGARYAWAVRACGTECSPWSRTQHVDVGRLRADFDGDGFADPVVGAPEASTGADDVGVVYVYGGGPGDPPDLRTTPMMLEAREPQDGARFGAALAAGDVDGDGFADLVVGEPGREIGAGRDHGAAWLFLGGPSGLTTPGTMLAPRTPEAGAEFGLAVAIVPDAGGAGTAAIAVGAPGADRVDLFDESGDVIRSITCAACSDDARFGEALAIGDLDGDARSDLVVGAPAHIDVTGAGLVLMVTAAGDPLRTLVGDTGSRTGASLVVLGDLDGDDLAEVVAGAPSAAAFVVVSSSSMTPAVRMPPMAGSTSELGTSIAAGDVDDSDAIDLLVGAPLYAGPTAGEGGAFLFNGMMGTGYTDATASILDPDIANVAGGTSVALGDVNGDGFADALVGAPGTTSPRVHLSTGSPDSSAFGRKPTELLAPAGGRFGHAVAL